MGIEGRVMTLPGVVTHCRLLASAHPKDPSVLKIRINFPPPTPKSADFTS